MPVLQGEVHTLCPLTWKGQGYGNERKGIDGIVLEGGINEYRGTSSYENEKQKQVGILLASLTMLGVELPLKKETKKIDLPTKGMKGLSNIDAV